jgi:hypothetical protein
MRRTHLLAAVWLLPVLAAWSRAEDLVVMTNGSRLRGRVTRQTDTSVTISMRGVTVTLPLGRVRSITTKSGQREINPVKGDVKQGSPRRSTGRSSDRSRSRPAPSSSVSRGSGRRAYETETWPKARRLVWAKPGQGGNLDDAASWLENGRPASAPPDRDTDIELPPADSRYVVRGATKKVRHATIERNGFLQGRHRGELEVWGNLWVKPGGWVYYVCIRGPKHTYFRIDDAEFPNPRNGTKYRHTSRGGVKLNRTQISHKFQICKYGDASCEFIGKFGVSDEIMVQHGKMIVAGDLRWSGVTSKGALEIYDGGVLELQSGATAGPFIGKNNKCVFNIDVYRNGVLQAGSPERPLTGNAYLMLGFGEDSKPGRTGLYAAAGSQIRVYSTDPEKAKLVVTSNTSRADFHNGMGQRVGDPDRRAQGETGVALQLAGDVDFDGVLFDYVSSGGIKLADPSARKRWSHVAFGPHNAGPPDTLFAKLSVNPHTYYHNRSDGQSEFGLTVKAVRSMEEYLRRNDTYRISVDPKPTEVKMDRKLSKPMPVLFTGPVQVKLSCTLAGAEIRYTLDGAEPDENSTPYSKPFTLTKTTRVRARAFAKGAAAGLAYSWAFVFK